MFKCCVQWDSFCVVVMLLLLLWLWLLSSSLSFFPLRLAVQLALRADEPLVSSFLCDDGSGHFLLDPHKAMQVRPAPRVRRAGG